MSESIQSTLISALPAATKVSDTDIVVLENGSTTQKITITQLKEALGINALNTKYTHELLTCSAGVVREYTFPNLPEHKISFPVLIGASSNIAGCVVARDTNATGKIKVYSPIQQDVQVLLIMLN